MRRVLGPLWALVVVVFLGLSTGIAFAQAQEGAVSSGEAPTASTDPSADTDGESPPEDAPDSADGDGPVATEPSDAVESSDAALSQTELEALIVFLEDDTERTAFLERLKQVQAVLAETPEEPPTITDTVVVVIAQRLKDIGDAVVSFADTLSTLPERVRGTVAEIRQGDLSTGLGERLGAILVILGTGAVVAVGFGMASRGIVRRLSNIGSRSILVRVLAFGSVTVLRLLPIVLFVLASYAVLSFMDIDFRGRLMALRIIHAIAAMRIVVVATDVLLVKTVAGLRLLPLSGENGSYLAIWIRRLASTLIYGTAIAGILALAGISPGASRGLTHLVGLIAAGLAVIAILQNRRMIADVLRENSGRGGLGILVRRAAELWHFVAILLVLVLLVVWVLDVEGGFSYILNGLASTIGVIVAARLLAMIGDRLLMRALAVPASMRQRYPSLERRANRYIPLLMRILHILVAIAAAMVILDLWGVDTIGLLQTDAGRRALSALSTIALVILLALAAWEIMSLVVERNLHGRSDGREVSARMRTLLPLLRNAITIVLLTFTVLIVLSELGIDIAPLLAGAGVVGLAIGFGSQALVRDVITGLFILIENTIQVGEVVTVAGHSGVVEEMTIRTVSLRDLSGQVHTVPWGDVTSVINMSKDYAFALFEVGVAYREDTDHVTNVLIDLGAELQTDPDVKMKILEPIEILGVDSLADSAVIIKARIKTRPGEQWGVMRAFNRLMKHRFDELGIEIPFPHTTVYFGEDKSGGAPSAHVSIDRMARPLRMVPDKPVHPPPAPSSVPDVDD